ncbi:hypothetical protein R3W88_031918 [Solanum pinnatisectum]|uniref:Reverse transcriptase zinc-binding domain-containing protein n=1 Tax=Solanum pinnatisectum TaxID=50273 RepID=A0AAV9LMQ9_9SOLN|nr:hypothetical protein R3W88_031918 [Solanum pinnatisectum]
MCKRFLWNGDKEGKGKALIAWETLCWPKTAGGLNITDMYVWNKTAILKHMWNLCKKKDRLWIVWVHTFYLKGRDPWEVDIKQASWMVKKILKAGKGLTERGLPVLKGEYNKVPWRRLTYNNLGSPKWVFALYVAIHRRLYTKDRLSKWGIIEDDVCALCKEEGETHQHLFFSCIFSKQIWHKMLKWQLITRGCEGWNEELEWAIGYAKRKSIVADVYRMAIAATIYYIWQERNLRIFQQKERTTDMISRLITQEIHHRASMIPRLTGYMQNLNFYP